MGCLTQDASDNARGLSFLDPEILRAAIAEGLPLAFPKFSSPFLYKVGAPTSYVTGVVSPYL